MASALALVVLGLGVLVAFGVFAAVSAGEGARRAVRVALALGATTGLPLVAAATDAALSRAPAPADTAHRAPAAGGQ